MDICQRKRLKINRNPQSRTHICAAGSEYKVGHCVSDDVRKSSWFATTLYPQYGHIDVKTIAAIEVDKEQDE